MQREAQSPAERLISNNKRSPKHSRKAQSPREVTDPPRAALLHTSGQESAHTSPRPHAQAGFPQDPKQSAWAVLARALTARATARSEIMKARIAGPVLILLPEL